MKKLGCQAGKITGVGEQKEAKSTKLEIPMKSGREVSKLQC